jgi:hypothetical protein
MNSVWRDKMKIKEILGEEASMVVKDFKPGQTLSMVDPTTDTMTVVDLKKNPGALKTNDQGEFSYDPTPDAGAPGEPKQPELKPGAQIQIDTATAEGFDSDVDVELQKIANAGDDGYNMIQDGLDGLMGSETQTALQDMYDSVSRERRLHPDDDFEEIVSNMLDLIDQDYGDSDADQPDRAEGMAPGTALDVKNERMDESAIITALARRVAGTEAKAKTKSKEVFDIKKLAGL